MGFVRYMECSNLISTKALFCPGCGAPNSNAHMILISVKPDESNMSSNVHQVGFNIHCLLSSNLVQGLGQKLLNAGCHVENVSPDDQERPAEDDDQQPKTVFEYMGAEFLGREK